MPKQLTEIRTILQADLDEISHVAIFTNFDVPTDTDSTEYDAGNKNILGWLTASKGRRDELGFVTYTIESADAICLETTVVSATALTITVADPSGFLENDRIEIDWIGLNDRDRKITNISGSIFTLGQALESIPDPGTEVKLKHSQIATIKGGSTPGTGRLDYIGQLIRFKNATTPDITENIKVKLRGF